MTLWAGAVGALATIAPLPLTSAPIEPQAAGTVQVRTEQVFALASAAQERGDLRVAEAAYDALARDPDRNVRSEALFRHAKLMRKDGRLERAATLLRKLLDQQPGALAARLELARMLDLLGDKDAAWRMMRSAQTDGLPLAVARIVDRYSEALRNARPLGASIEIAIAPDSNISRSTRSDTLGTILGDFEIDEDSKAKSGLGLALRGQVYRRFGLSNGRASILARASGFADLYKQSDFNDVAINLAAGPEVFVGRSRLQLELGTTQRWLGQKPSLRAARIKGTWTLALDRRSQFRLAASASLHDYHENDLQDGKRLLADISYERALTQDMGLALTLGLDRDLTRDRAYSTRSWRTGVTFWRDVGRMTLTAGAEFGRLRADDRLALLPEERNDRYYRMNFGSTFRQLTFAGFAPVTRLVIERNESTIAFHDYRKTRMEFGLVRPF